MIICGERVRVKENRPNIEEGYGGEEGYIFSRNRMLRALGAGLYEIKFIKPELNHPIMGVMGGFNEDDLEVIR
jgi:hypothetical protein